MGTRAHVVSVMTVLLGSRMIRGTMTMAEKGKLGTRAHTASEGSSSQVTHHKWGLDHLPQAKFFVHRYLASYFLP